MSKYGEIALRATALVREQMYSPPEAWAFAARELLPHSVSGQMKGCPKGAYLGLCEQGLVVGVRRGHYTTSTANKGYAVEAVRLLTRDPSLADPGSRGGGAMNLWLLLQHGEWKQPNSQMDVVLALWNNGLVVRQAVAVTAR